MNQLKQIIKLNPKFPFVWKTNKGLNTLNANSKVHILPALEDNYMYVVVDKNENIALAVDPVDPEKVFNVIMKEKASLIAILTTHHHRDHAGGNRIILNEIKNLPVYGGDQRIEALTNKIRHNDKITIGSFTIECLSTPCHTRGHMCYHFKDRQNPMCFTGDTLFVAGCGRFFEGTAGDMLNAMDILAKLDKNTKIFCGHEYTIKNLKFAAHVEPLNSNITEKLFQALEACSRNLPTVPSTIEDELRYNPFMRVREKEIQEFTGLSDPVEVMAELRKQKDSFV